MKRKSDPCLRKNKINEKYLCVPDLHLADKDYKRYYYKYSHRIRGNQVWKIREQMVKMTQQIKNLNKEKKLF